MSSVNGFKDVFSRPVDSLPSSSTQSAVSPRSILRKPPLKRSISLDDEVASILSIPGIHADSSKKTVQWSNDNPHVYFTYSAQEYRRNAPIPQSLIQYQQKLESIFRRREVLERVFKPLARRLGINVEQDSWLTQFLSSSKRTSESGTEGSTSEHFSSQNVRSPSPLMDQGHPNAGRRTSL